SVRATNQGTGATSRATTAADGSYTISNLAPGAYTVSASLLGQRAASQKDVRVAAGAAVSLDLVLQPLTLEAVTVTAMLREQEVKDVPFSVAAPTAQLLRTRGADNIEGIAANVAGFAVQNLGPGQSQPAIRGASSGQIARDQPGVKEEVGAYLDEVPISLSLFTPDLDLFDVARVEVLRGPQGTLFGSGSLGGTVRYISNQPELGESSTFGETGVSVIDAGAPGSSAKLGFKVPLGDKPASPGDARAAPALHPDRGALPRPVPAHRPDPEIPRRTRELDLDPVLHAPRHLGRSRRDRPDLEHHGRDHRSPGEHLLSRGA